MVSLGRLSKNEIKESSDLTNLLYTLHVTPIFDAIGIKEIGEETNIDPTLQDLRDIIRSGKLYIPNDKPHLTPYKQVSEITILRNGKSLKQDKIILLTLYMERSYVWLRMDPTQGKMLYKGV